MKAELFVRMFHLQQDKLNLCLEFNERVSELFKDNIYIIPSTVKEEFIKIAQSFIDRYNILLGEEGKDEEEKEEG